jgi:hypothetical protein
MIHRRFSDVTSRGVKGLWSGIKDGFYIVLYWLFGTPILAGFDRIMYGRQSRFLDVGCLAIYDVLRGLYWVPKSRHPDRFSLQIPLSRLASCQFPAPNFFSNTVQHIMI